MNEMGCPGLGNLRINPNKSRERGHEIAFYADGIFLHALRYRSGRFDIKALSAPPSGKSILP
jgi:hypothetical protein